MMWLMIMMSMTTGMMFIQMSHPLAMGLTLLVQTALICLMTGIMSKSFWFSYILFLIFIGGMLVLFIYITALASNEMFSLPTNYLYPAMMITVIATPMVIMNDLFPINNNNMNIDSLKLSATKSFYMETSIDLMKLYNYPTNYITIMMMSYLLITLIAVVKVTSALQGPLRKLN